MQTYETSVTVEDHGTVRLDGLPFAPGTEVEIAISPKRRPGEEFAAAWQRLCADLRGRAGVKDMTDEEIGEQIVALGTVGQNATTERAMAVAGRRLI